VITVVPTVPEEGDPFDYQATVNELTVQFLSEYEETRVAALKWLIMLHQKAPKKVLREGTQHLELISSSDPRYGRRHVPCSLENLVRQLGRGRKFATPTWHCFLNS
jgi:hypothetical protein